MAFHVLAILRHITPLVECPSIWVVPQWMVPIHCEILLSPNSLHFRIQHIKLHKTIPPAFFVLQTICCNYRPGRLLVVACY